MCYGSNCSLPGTHGGPRRRLSLPASLLEPIPNLEYWHYLDRPDYFAALSVKHPGVLIPDLILY